MELRPVLRSGLPLERVVTDRTFHWQHCNGKGKEDQMSRRITCILGNCWVVSDYLGRSYKRGCPFLLFSCTSLLDKATATTASILFAFLITLLSFYSLWVLCHTWGILLILGIVPKTWGQPGVIGMSEDILTGDLHSQGWVSSSYG
jgi:hypothetical protein